MVARAAPEVHDLVAFDHAAGLDRGQVGAVVRLGEALAVHVLAGDDPGQEVLLLLRSAVHDDGRPDQGFTHATGHPGHAGPVELLVEDGHPHRVHALAAELLRPLRADQLFLLQLDHPLGVSGVAGRGGDLLSCAAARGGRHVPVDQAGQRLGRLGRDPVPQLSAE
jgi:hypothetical protein